MYKKVPTNSCGYKIWTSWGVVPTILEFKLLSRHFSKMGVKRDFSKIKRPSFKITQIKFQGKSPIIFVRGPINL